MPDILHQPNHEIHITIGKIDEVVSLSSQIPEFQHPHGKEEYMKRLHHVPHLILLGRLMQRPVGFKVGYEKYHDGSFYSWMGGILPAYRHLGIAKALATYQETWAKKAGYKSIKMKTRNRLKPMLIFSIKNGFDIVAIEPRPLLAEYRILLEKKI